MKLSRESEYGIQGLIHLAQQPSGTVTQLAGIAEAQGLPQSFLAKIFQKFLQYGLVRSFRGATRGYTLGRPAAENPCVLQEGWKQIKPKVTAMMEVTTLQDLVRRTATARRHKRGR